MKANHQRVKRGFRQAAAWLGLGLVGWVLASCAETPSLAPPAQAPMVEADSYGRADASPMVEAPAAKKARTGIATGWGRELGSSMSYTDFVRHSVTPIGLSTIRYNDREGAKEMGVSLGRETSGMQEAAGGLVEWGMSSGWGSLDSYWWRGGRFVVGKKGREYEIKIKNLTNVRVEAVLSVDGLDVIDGKSASTKKRGYIVNPRQTLVVKGFRTSSDAVASFKFSSVGNSYANLRHGDTRNVGVVGLAVFQEKGARPWAEARQRGQARAFAEAPTMRARD